MPRCCSAMRYRNPLQLVPSHPIQPFLSHYGLTMAPKAKKEAAASTEPADAKSPPPEKPSQTRNRTYIIISYWLVVIFLGLPVWWMTTAIYRAHLPLDGMMQWADGKVITCVAAIDPYSCYTQLADHGPLRIRPAAPSFPCKYPSVPMPCSTKTPSISSV